MNLLIAGNGPETLALCQRLAGQEAVSVTHCADGRGAIERFRGSREQFGWVFLENQGSCHEGMNVAREIRRIDPDIPITFLKHSRRSGYASDTSHLAVCAVERTENGLEILRCARHAEHLQQGADLRSEEVVRDRPWSFEYHAPCKRSH